LLKVYH
jgi:hypothetical protein